MIIYIPSSGGVSRSHAITPIQVMGAKATVRIATQVVLAVTTRGSRHWLPSTFFRNVTLVHTYTYARSYRIYVSLRFINRVFDRTHFRSHDRAHFYYYRGGTWAE